MKAASSGDVYRGVAQAFNEESLPKDKGTAMYVANERAPGTHFRHLQSHDADSAPIADYPLFGAVARAEHCPHAGDATARLGMPV